MQHVDPGWLWQAVQFIFATLGVVACVVGMFNGRRAQKRDVAMVEDFATRKELQALAMRVEEKFEALRCEIQADKNEILRAGETRVVKLHDRINEILSAVSELRGEVHSSRRNHE